MNPADHYTPTPMHVCSCGQPHHQPVPQQYYPPYQPPIVYAPAAAPAAQSQVGKYLAIGAGGAAILIPTMLAVTAALIAAGVAALALAVATLVIRWVIADMRRNR